MVRDSITYLMNFYSLILKIAQLSLGITFKEVIHSLNFMVFI